MFDEFDERHVQPEMVQARAARHVLVVALDEINEIPTIVRERSPAQCLRA
jgi:hypothetical protein